MKPRLVFADRLWNCGIVDHRLASGAVRLFRPVGIGYTPSMAFDDWKMRQPCGRFG